MRYPFADTAATALAEYAAQVGTHVGALDPFFQQRQLHHAVSGQYLVSYKVVTQGPVVIEKTTEQHLEKGDHSFRENAARVYFDCIEYAKKG